MIEQHIIELIHGEVDGVNSTSEQAELLHLLETREDVRTYREKMRDLYSLLQSVPAHHEPPPDLRARISNAIHETVTPESGIRFAKRNRLSLDIKNITTIHSSFTRVNIMKNKYIFGVA